MLGGAVRRMALQALRASSFRSMSSHHVRFPSQLTATVAPFRTQNRYSSVEVFGPFDPPKQLTFHEVEERVLKAIRAWDRFPEDKAGLLKMDSSFSEMGFDSLDHVEIMMAIEDEFSFEVPLADAEKLKTPRDIFKFICEREDVFE